MNNPNCGHEGATFRLEGNLYCKRCAPYAWQNFVHRGHPDEPAMVAVSDPELTPAHRANYAGGGIL